MNLDQAIKKIINDHGADILKERRVVSMLSDLQAFGQLPYAANMLRQIYANGYGTKIHQLYCSQDQTEVAAFLSELRNKLGFDMDMLGKVLYAFSLPVQRAGKQKQVGNKQHTIPAKKSNMDLIKYKGHRAYRDEYGGIYSYPNCEVFYKLEINVQSYSLMDNTKVIYSEAFMNCKTLREIVLPNSITIIDNSAFRGCSSLQEITIPDTVTSIGDSAFYVCTSLQEITLPDSLTSIGENAFWGCDSLHKITIPDSVTSIGESAFWGCNSLHKITIPDSVTSIGDYTFSGCTSLQEITIPDSVTSIGKSAFCDCTSLQETTLPDSLTSIGEGAFWGCKSLQKIAIPDSVTMIRANTFYDCYSLQDITLSESATIIESNAFAFCPSLKKLTIPESVKSIEDYAFSGIHLTELFIKSETPPNLGAEGPCMFYSDCKIYIPYGSKYKYQSHKDWHNYYYQFTEKYAFS